MRQSKAEIYMHFVWTTRCREPLIADAIERDLYRFIQAEAAKLGCVVLGLDGTGDHVHLLALMPRALSASRLMHQVKGASSRFVHTHFSQAEGFGWQDGYGVFSIGRPQVEAVQAYIQRQKQRHAANKVWPQWEETDDKIEE